MSWVRSCGGRVVAHHARGMLCVGHCNRVFVVRKGNRGEGSVCGVLLLELADEFFDFVGGDVVPLGAVMADEFLCFVL